MLANPQEVMSRFQQILAREVAESTETGPGASLRVADLYYELVPFESLRGELGVASIYEYEQALVWLLAGHGDMLEMESIADRQKLQRHVQTRQFDTGFLRDFFNAGVRICFSPEAAPSPETAAFPEKKTLDESGPAITEEEQELPWFEDCPSCTEPLPKQSGVDFCPFCGSDLRRVPCTSCGETLKLDWRFCIACGIQVEPRSGLLAPH